jgi:hypothetical protein
MVQISFVFLYLHASTQRCIIFASWVETSEYDIVEHALAASAFYSTYLAPFSDANKKGGKTRLSRQIFQANEFMFHFDHEVSNLLFFLGSQWLDSKTRHAFCGGRFNHVVFS